MSDDAPEIIPEEQEEIEEQAEPQELPAAKKGFVWAIAKPEIAADVVSYKTKKEDYRIGKEEYVQVPKDCQKSPQAEKLIFS